MRLGQARSLLLRMSLHRNAPSVALLLAASAAVAAPATISFNIPAGSLADVLTQIGSAASSTISFSPATVQGLQAGPISGSMTVHQAVQRAIAGKHLKAIVGSGGAIAITGTGSSQRGASNSGIATDIPDIDVSGGNAAGSSDPLATEGTHSYSTDLANIATKTPLSIQETPQSVSVVTQQQIQDRHVTSLEQAVDATPGVVVQQNGGSNLATTFVSRGFNINSLSVDGGAPVSIGMIGSGRNTYSSNFTPALDMSEYDSLSILRGSGGQYSGAGDPGGTLSLERKRPLDHESLSIDQTFGSYNDYRTVLDGNLKPMLDGKLKIRGVFTNEDQHYFFNTARKDLDLAYLAAELQLTPTTKLNFGGSYNNTRAVPFSGGLPFFQNGAAPAYSRDTCICVPWNNTHFVTQEYFFQAEQRLPADWSAHFNGARTAQQTSTRNLSLFTFNGLNPDTTGFTSPSENIESFQSEQYQADGYVTGKVYPFGVLTEMTLGASYQTVNQQAVGGMLSGSYPASFNPTAIPWNPSLFQPLPTNQLFFAPPDAPSSNQEQLGGYWSTRISPVPWAHLLVSQRVSAYRQHQLTDNTAVGGDISDQKTNDLHVPIPNVGLTFDVLKDTSIYGSYNTIYQVTTGQKTPQGGLLTPVSGDTWEGGIKRGFFNNRLQTSLAYYSTVENNLPQINPAYEAVSALIPGCCYIQDGSKFVSKGVDLEIAGKVTEDWDVTFSYNYNDNHSVRGPYDTSDQTSINSQFPAHMIKLFSTYRLWSPVPEWNQYFRKTQIGFGANYQSLSSIYGANTSFDGTTTTPWYSSQKGYVIFQMMGRYEINSHAALQLNAYNLTDRKYYSSIGGAGGGNFFGTPRSFSGSLHLQF